MSNPDLITLVAMRIAESDGHTWPWSRQSPSVQSIYLTNARAVIIAVFDDLIDTAPENATIHNHEGYFADLADWLSCQRPSEFRHREEGK